MIENFQIIFNDFVKVKLLNVDLPSNLGIYNYTREIPNMGSGNACGLGCLLDQKINRTILQFIDKYTSSRVDLSPLKRFSRFKLYLITYIRNMFF